MSRLPLLRVNIGPDTFCVRTEPHCGRCHSAKLYTRAIVKHGKQGFQKGCACVICEAWHQKELRRQRRSYRQHAINNRGTINVLRNGL